jgi:hypothetical protein
MEEFIDDETGIIPILDEPNVLRNSIMTPRVAGVKEEILLDIISGTPVQCARKAIKAGSKCGDWTEVLDTDMPD